MIAIAFGTAIGSQMFFAVARGILVSNDPTEFLDLSSYALNGAVMTS